MTTIKSLNISTGEITTESLSDEEIAADQAYQTEKAKTAYVVKRQFSYPTLGEFADAMYWNSKGDSTKLEAYYAACEKVKSDNPKPS
tara:strand:+ start:215 stop:475 length:261 start_codon:yes stop_codon:yes gene_type:complete